MKKRLMAFLGSIKGDGANIQEESEGKSFKGRKEFVQQKKESVEQMKESPEDRKEFIELVRAAREEWKMAQDFFENVSDPDLVDYAIYRAEAARRKYIYYIKQAKIRMNQDGYTDGSPSAGLNL